MLEGKGKNEKMKIFKTMKDWKSQKMVSEEVFLKFLTGELKEVDFFNNSTLWKSDQLGKAFKEEATIHNTINRLTD